MKEKKSIRIVVAGVGGAGVNTVDYMINNDPQKVEFMVVNTDVTKLNYSNASIKVLLGPNIGLVQDSFRQPARVKSAAMESYDELCRVLRGADIVFIVAGFGGSTGTTASPIVAKAAKEMGALTIAVVTRPFKFEGAKRASLAEKGLGELGKECDSVVAIPNDKLLSIIDNNIGMRECFKIVDSVLAQAVSTLYSLISIQDEKDVNLDLDDLKTIMSHRGEAFVGMGECQGEYAALEAMKSAIESPLMDNMSIKGARGVLVLFQMHPKFSMIEMSEAMEIIHENAHDDADVIFGTLTDINMPIDAIRITLVATGFEEMGYSSANNTDFSPSL